MSDPISITVQLCDPADPDVQALAACESILETIMPTGTVNNATGESAGAARCRVVAWLAEKYLKSEVSIGSSFSMSDHLPLPMCSKVDCIRTGWLPCNSTDCPKRAR